MKSVICICRFIMIILVFIAPLKTHAVTIDETPAAEGEWGYRPADGAVSKVNPPSFSWRPQEGMEWEVEVARDAAFDAIEYRAEGIMFNVHCPSRVFQPGTYSWRYRGHTADGSVTSWSVVRTFSIDHEASEMPLPPRDKLLARIPGTHPRLFVRPENMENLRRLAKGDLKDIYDRLADQCEALLADPPPIDEPPMYPEGIERGSRPWRKIWWGNRMRVVQALNGAATLAFTRLIGGPEEYGIEAKRLLLECARWDPKGSTSFHYNDEAGMPYAYFFSRTYTFVNDLLSEQEKELCRQVMKVRGEEMYDHLCPDHFWHTYNSHNNRAWHFLGEVGIAFHGEIEGADDWTWFASNVFFNTYPVWSDDDGGWHEGISYWWEYQERFTWFADVMREAIGINAFEKPYYSKVGYYALYLRPPGTSRTGFGDLVGVRKPSNYVPLMTTFAAQSGNPHWQWWVEQMDGPVNTSQYHAHGDYISYIHGALPKVASMAPDDLPASRLFRGTGRAYLNSTLADGAENVQVVFKSSPFGSQSHGYEANNSFNLWAYGKNMLIRTGRRDHYASDHHKNWMWSARSTNCIRIGGRDQILQSASNKGEISAFKTTPAVDIAVGETKDFTRTIIFIKPELVIVFDRLRSDDPTFYEYWLHAANRIETPDQHSIRVVNDDVICDIDFLAPGGLTFTQTDQYDPNPRADITLRQWHLAATTSGMRDSMEFVTLYRPHRVGEDVPVTAELEHVDGGYTLRAELSGGGEAAVLLPAGDGVMVEGYGMRNNVVTVKLKGADGASKMVTLDK